MYPSTVLLCLIDWAGKKKDLNNTINENDLIKKNGTLCPIIREHMFLKNIGNISANYCPCKSSLNTF